MALYPVAMKPGIFRSGTAYSSKGRWYDCNLVRFYQDAILPWGGWRKKSTTTFTGVGRAILSWVTNDGSTTWTAIGTESGLYAMTRSGVLHDITPSGFTTGRVDAIAQGGFGSGPFGVGTFGSPRPDTSTIQPASMWALDKWGEKLNGVMGDDDGIIYEWSLDTATAAVAVANAPSCKSLLVTNEENLMALGAEGVGRRVKWSAKRDNTTWTADATNDAGDYDLQTNGTILEGIRVNGGNLIITTLDAHVGTPTGDILVYGFKKVGDGCGGISRDCAAALDGQAVWMGRGGFFTYNGYVSSLDCDVGDYVFRNLNVTQASKVTCRINANFGEVCWHYPSANSTEVDSYVVWNYRENHWAIGSLDRLAGVDAGITQYPMLTGTDGYVYEHEVGNNYGSSVPYLESGPIEAGNGDNVSYAMQFLSDDLTVGDVTLTLKSKFEPDGVETSTGPYTVTKRTDVRACGRQIRVRFDGSATASWRIGVPRLLLKEGGER